jgi:hypothetical protein
VNEKGRLSILAPTTLATRGELVESIERQLSRPSKHDLNAAMPRASEAKRRGVAAYSHREPSGLRNNLPSFLKAPVAIASDRTVGLLDDLQNCGSIVFRDRFFDATGRQIQDMQVSRDHLPATVLMTNAMNTSKDLDDLLCQGEIPRLLNQELKERKPLKQSVEPHHSKVSPSSSKEFSAQSSSDSAPLELAVTNRGKRKDEITPQQSSPFTCVGSGACSHA